MSLAYALPFFCDVMLYFGAVGCFGLLYYCRDALAWTPVMLLAACWLSGKLTGRGKPWLRWLPMAVAAPCLIVAGNMTGCFACLPMLVYLPLYVNNNWRAPDYDYAADRFRHSLIALALVVLLALLFQAAHWKDGLPWLFMYFTLNIALLRLLRHDDGVARSLRFRVINLGGVALVCAAGFGLSQPGIVAVIGAGWRWFLENVVLNALALIAYLIQWVLYLGARLLMWMGISGVESDAMPDINPVAGLGSELPRTAREIRALPPVVLFLLKAAGVALLATLTFLILRALSRRVARAEFSNSSEERETLDAAPGRPLQSRLRRGTENGVRQWYRRSLLMLRARGGRVSPTMNTLQILEQNAATADPEALRALREVYLPVRYGGREGGREDVRRAREAYEKLRSTLAHTQR